MSGYGIHLPRRHSRLHRSFEGGDEVTATQVSLFDAAPVAQVRKHDPRTAKQAAALNPDGRATQAQRILRHLWSAGEITADYAHRHLSEGEDVTRGEWSARVGVLIHRGLVERAGEVDEFDRHGRTRRVLAYRLTAAGRAECERMWGVR